ncbi:hypothetical protein OSB04_018690 [Centaurea solstitialis]|uniref:TIR domain-containing protein n=1 Tax=Centaurea solstitialis TaxID=347529 RepID=A0AA38WJJ8_9ASTR|nr:hypothetical protein OSB04_018690 [Centaurea solstitialis]
MASSSSSSFHSTPPSSSSSQSLKYDVFLSFRGTDTRNTFIDHLYSALCHQAIHTYKDDITLPRGETIDIALLTAIEKSQIAIIVFSENYADSSWCLQELAHIMKCKDQRGLTVMPIFYHIEPSELRNLTKKYGEAFAKYELGNKKVELWRKALVDAGNLSGYVANGIKALKVWFNGPRDRQLPPSLPQVVGNMKKLRLISMNGYPATSLPREFPPMELCYLQLVWSRVEQLWEGNKCLPNLKVLDLSFSSKLSRTPDLDGLPYLERLILFGCSSLKELHPSIGYHESIIFLDLHACFALEIFPPIIRMKKLETLQLSSCSQLRKFPEIQTSLDNLVKLSLNNSGIEIVPSSVGRYCTNLVSLDLRDCFNLQSIEGNFHRLQHLKGLYLDHCNQLKNIPTEGLFDVECSLQLLSLSEMSLQNLHRGAVNGLLGFSHFLKRLNLRSCNLVDGDISPEFFKELSNLEALDLRGNNFSQLHSSLSQLPCLKYLDLSRCENLVELPDLPSSIAILIAERCYALDIVGDFPTSDLKWLWKVSLTTYNTSGDGGRIVQSMLQWPQLLLLLNRVNMIGTDVRNNFVDHLYSALVQQGIFTYKDDKTLPRGETIGPSLLKAIEESQIAVIVFSENYADSSWCLQELAHIMKCKDERGLIVIPIFYHMDPSELRKPKGKYGEALAKHESEKNDVESWREALVDAGNLSGDVANGPETVFIKQIVETISNRLHAPNSSDDEDLIGIEARLQDLKSKMEMESDRVLMVGIWGLGGGGKTTLASALYDEIYNKFDGSCFLKDVREESSKHGLEELQEKVLSIILKQKREEVVGDVGRLIKSRFRRKKVLMVLDDVDHVDQLKELAGSNAWFGKGSRIIITTRNNHLLNVHKVNVVYNISLLNDDEAIKLFCKHALGDGSHLEDREMLSKDVVSYVGGLPLALKVLGSFLCDKNKSEWTSALARLKQIPDSDIVEKLKISYDGLERVEKELFLDIACFFRRKEKDEAMVLLDACGFHPIIGVKVLIQKALITVSRKEGLETFDMHDLIQEMGHYIVRGQNLENPETHSRVWQGEDVVKLCTMDAKTENDKIKALQIEWYRVKHPRFPEVVANMKQLRSFSCFKYRATSLPREFQPMELRCLQLHSSLVKQLWEGYKHLPNLKVLDLYFSRKLIRTPDFDGLPCLERIILKHCTMLKEIHPSIGYHERLIFLDMESCTSLKTFPTIIRMKKLETLILSQCCNLGKFPEMETSMDNLAKLSLRGSGIEIVPSSIGQYCTNLVSLDLTDCINLHSIEGNFHLLKHLEGFYFEGCDELKNIPTEGLFDVECCLQVLSLSSTSFKNLYRGAVNFELLAFSGFLRKLSLSYCNLVDGDISSVFCEELSNLQALDLSGNDFSQLHSSLLQLPRLKFLNLSDCKNLVELPNLPSSISVLITEGCNSLDVIGDFQSNLKWLWKVSLSGRNFNGERVLQSLLQGYAVEDHFISALFDDRVAIPIRGWKLETFTLQLPRDWFNEFCGFLVYVDWHIGEDEEIIINDVLEVPYETDDDVLRVMTANGVWYVSFGSLRDTLWWKSTHTTISFSLARDICLKVELVPKRSQCDDLVRTTKDTTHHSEFWDGGSQNKKTFEIIRDSKSSIEIRWRHDTHSDLSMRETIFIKEIVETISNKLWVTISSDNDGLVGIKARLHDLKSNREMESADGVVMVGIWGSGGGGKTTLASSLYNEISSKFHVCCFIENIREESSKFGLPKLQKDILALVSNQKHINRVEDGRRLIKDRFCCKKALIVLDDVDHLDQLEALVGSCDWFGEGSRIVITTRDMHILTAHKVNVIYNISLLDPDEAMKLFRKRAPQRGRPLEDYEILSKEVVSYAGGLPLALKVLGSFLCDKDISEWRSALARLKDIPESGIVEKLKISYDGLEPVEKELFLDIACFFRGKEKDKAMEILDACGFHPTIGVKVLIEKALITMSREGVLDMHDLIQEMGHHIVRGENPKNPELHSRVWQAEDAVNICAMDATKENDMIQAFKLSLREDEEEDIPPNLPQVVGNMKKLRLISWLNYPATTLPREFQPTNLCYLSLSWSLVEQLWEGNKVLPSLKVLDLSCSKRLVSTPDFKGLPYLERMILSDCESLKEIHLSIGYHKRLTFVNMERCIRLELFPPIFRMKKLETLLLSSCHNLRKFPKIHACMDNLKELCLERSGIEVVPSSIGEYCTNLHSLDLRGCKNLQRIEGNFHHLKHLKALYLNGCDQLKSIPAEGLFDIDCCLQLLSSFRNLLHRGMVNLNLFGFSSSLKRLSLRDCNLVDGDIFSVFCEELSNLQTLDLSRNKFSRLHSSLSQLRRLKILDLSCCDNLIELPDLPPSISILVAQGCNSLDVTGDFPTNLKWLWKVLLSAKKCNVQHILQSMLQVNAIEDYYISILLDGPYIPIRGVADEIFTLQLSWNWKNKFSGFLVYVDCWDKSWGNVIVIKEVMVRENKDDILKVSNEEEKSKRMRGMRYISFSSLKNTSWWKSTHTTISFFIEEGVCLKVELVSKRSRGDNVSIGRPKDPAYRSEFWDEESPNGKTVEIIHDSESCIKIQYPLSYYDVCGLA